MFNRRSVFIVISVAFLLEGGPSGSFATGPAHAAAGPAVVPVASSAPASPPAGSSVEALAAEAMRLWALREDARQAPSLYRALEAWSAASPRDATPLVLYSHASYWFAHLLEAGGDAKARMAQLARGLEAGRKAARLAPTNPGGDFWAATNLGIYSHMAGAVKSVSSLPEIRERLGRVEKLAPSYAHGGVWRYYGRLIDQVPGTLRMMYGYNLDNALEFYRKALEAEPRALQTHVYLAECLLQKGEKEKAKARLEAVVRADPTGVPAILPENRLFQRHAREMLQRGLR